ncbi:MAG: MerR family transcriptional regulator [Candidatus Nanoarchaeia archaeon]|jgi:DNA-binding transcriptional MerR regulator|nr:MerR family transcriptional regulator [Candidatus Nanoarchaeia archaeon]
MQQIDSNSIYKLKETARFLCVSESTLRSWDRNGYFIAGRTVGKHRVYTGEQIINIQKKMFENVKSKEF